MSLKGVAFQQHQSPIRQQAAHSGRQQSRHKKDPRVATRETSKLSQSKIYSYMNKAN